MKPVERMLSMATLDFTPSLPDGDEALPPRLQAVALLLQEDRDQHGQLPETHDGDGAHQLILIQAQFFLAMAKEDFDTPTSCDVHEQRLRARFHITGSPIACLRHRGIQRLPHDHDLATVQAEHLCRHGMHVNRLFSFGPCQLDGVARAQLSGIPRQASPLPAIGRAWIYYGKPAIALDPRRDQKLPLPCREPVAFGTVAAIKQDMRHRSCDWLKCANRAFHHLDLALEGDAFHSAGLLLSIQLGSQGTAHLLQLIPEGVAKRKKSINPNRTVTQYWYWGFENTFRNRSAKWRISSSNHRMGTGIGHLRGFKDVFSSSCIPHSVLSCYPLSKSANIEYLNNATLTN
jgi:hypothetical protein